MELLNKLMAKISSSLNSDTPTSSVRTQAYMIIFPIIMMITVFVIIELWSFIHAIHAGTPYILSNQIITIYGMTLAHHLSLVFSRTKNPAAGDQAAGNADDKTDKPADQAPVTP